VTKEISLDLNKVGEGNDPFGKHRAGFYTELTIHRSDYGMDKLMNAVGDEVQLYLAFEGLPGS
jgi:polyisoprenoid-binding protein YceI